MNIHPAQLSLEGNCVLYIENVWKTLSKTRRPVYCIMNVHHFYRFREHLSAHMMNTVLGNRCMRIIVLQFK